MTIPWSSSTHGATALVMALTVGAAGLCPASVHAITAFTIEAAASPVLEVEVDPKMLQGKAHRSWVEARAGAVLERRAGAVEAGDHIVVALAGTSYDYRVEIRVLRGGEPLASQPEPFVCEGSSEELLLQVEVAVDDAVDRLIEARQREQTEREQAERERVARERAAKEEEERRLLAARPYRPGGLGLAGAVTLGLGSAAVVAGAIVTARGVVSPNDLLEPLDFHPPGYALLGAGSVVLVTGLGMLVADVVRCKKDRVKCGQRGPLLQRAARASRGVVLRW
jgi:hypothetical protein